MKNTASKTLNTKATTSIKARSKSKEAKAHRIVNEEWQRLEATGKYRKAAAKSIGWNTTDKIADEVLDGILLNLNKRNSEKPASEQRKLFRHIVEKRQAQAIHSKTRNSRDRKSAIAVIVNSSKCMERLHYLRYAG